VNDKLVEEFEKTNSFNDRIALLISVYDDIRYSEQPEA
jgi:hypothetical protein